MKKCQFIVTLSTCAILITSLLGCKYSNETSKISIAQSDSSVTTAEIASADMSVAVADEQQEEAANMVDERFELLSLVFRLAGREEYGEENTEYQKQLGAEFGGYKEHAAVKYAEKLPLGYDAVFNFSVHIEKDGEQFALIEDIGSLVEDGRWTQQTAGEFLQLLNDFYAETGFSAFYQSNMDFYKTETQVFVDNMYSQIDLEWFSAYVAPENLRCVFSPSSSRNNYGATVNDTIVYCAVSGEGSVIVHEYCHSFANSIAHKWYKENPEFKKWCDDTVDPEKLPSYGNGQIIAGEYVTRAYNTLYYAEHGYALPPLFYGEKGQGFSYIEDVYAMITPHEKSKVGDNKIESILGVQYEMGEEQSFSIENRQLRWKVLTLADPLQYIYQPTEVGNVFGSNTDDVLYVEDTAEENPYLLIDLGETTFQGKEGYRLYSRIPIE